MRSIKASPKLKKKETAESRAAPREIRQGKQRMLMRTRTCWKSYKN